MVVMLAWRICMGLIIDADASDDGDDGDNRGNGYGGRV